MRDTLKYLLVSTETEGPFLRKTGMHLLETAHGVDNGSLLKALLP